MTNRDRFKAVMNFETTDRLPYFQEGIRKAVLKSWFKQGLQPESNLSELFHTDPFEEFAPDLDPLPGFKKWPQSEDELPKLKKHLDPDDPRRLPKNSYKKIDNAQDTVLFLRVHRGLFISLGINDWRRFEQIMSLLTEKPVFVRKYMEIQGEFAALFADKILNKIEIDAAIFSEPISSNEGPLISPVMYEEFALKSYLPLMQVLKKHKIATIIFRTYANSRILLPVVLKYGFNCLWACETNAEAMDYKEIRREFGTDLRLIGGIDLDVLRHGKDVIRRELENKIPPLVRNGGYIPLADGRVREDILLENYIYYRNLLFEMIS